MQNVFISAKFIFCNYRKISSRTIKKALYINVILYNKKINEIIVLTLQNNVKMSESSV